MRLIASGATVTKFSFDDGEWTPARNLVEVMGVFAAAMKMNMPLSIFESGLHVIVGDCERYPEIETGGALFGLWTQTGAPVVMLATRSAPMPSMNVTHFLADERNTNRHASFSREFRPAMDRPLAFRIIDWVSKELSGGRVANPAPSQRTQPRSFLRDPVFLVPARDGAQRSTAGKPEAVHLSRRQKGNEPPRSSVSFPATARLAAASEGHTASISLWLHRWPEIRSCNCRLVMSEPLVMEIASKMARATATLAVPADGRLEPRSRMSPLYEANPSTKRASATTRRVPETDTAIDL